MRSALILVTALFASLVQAAPADVVSFDRSYWPEQLDSPVLFDVASRAEILMFARVLRESEELDEKTLTGQLQLRQINLAAVNAVRERFWQRLWQNYEQAQKSCEQDASFCYVIESQYDLRQQASKFEVAADSFYAHWAPAARLFHQRYLNQQLRNAALFPQTSSEVERFSPLELNGDGLNDRVFLLTFDGGPGLSTAALTDYLRRQNQTAAFFLLGSGVEKQGERMAAKDLQALYREQCVGMLGWEYRSHAYWKDWQESVSRSIARLQGDVPEQFIPLFRPPYGQRRPDAAEQLAKQNVRVALWDIDAQDDTSLNAEQSAQRVLTLMLLWRRGVIQFHDGQPKAQSAVTWLLQHTGQSGIAWEDCQTWAARG